MTVQKATQLVFGSASVVLVCFAVWALSRTPCVGVADINDFWRVMRPAGIEHCTPLTDPGYYVRCTFKTGPSDFFSGPSSSALLALTAKHVGAFLSPATGFMDLRQMGLVQFFLAAAALAMGLRAGMPVTLGFLFLYVLVDPGYLLFFNSFYADGTLFIALFGTVIWLERNGGMPDSPRRPSRARQITSYFVLFVLVLLGGGSKMQYVLFPEVLAVAIAVGLVCVGRVSLKRAAFLAAILVPLSIVTMWSFFFGSSPRFLKVNNYHAVYGGVLRVATDPEQVLRDLGVPTEYRDLPTADIWSAGIENSHPVHQHLKGLSRLDLLWMYATDPSALSGTMSAIETEISRVESHPRGNHVQDSPRVRRKTFETCWQFSRPSRLLLAAWPAGIWWLIGGSAAWLAVTARSRKWNGTHTASLFLILWVLSQFVVVVLGEGQINLLQHLVGARLGLDLLIVLVVLGMTNGLARRSARVMRGRSVGSDAVS